MSIVGTRPPLISETNLYEPRHTVLLTFTLHSYFLCIGNWCVYKYVGCQTCEDNEKRIYILSPTERCRTTNKVTSMSRSEMFM